MPNWNEILKEISHEGSTHDIVRRRYLKKLHDITGRNIIIYYSGWLQKPDTHLKPLVNDSDKPGFMTVINNMDRSLGLDLILHTPGGETAATESIVDYLRSIFGTNIRAVIPQLAMSAGTMIACACKEIILGKQSSLGPIDPQIGGVAPAHGIIEEFNRAIEEIRNDHSKIPVWQIILSKYTPALIGECEKAIQWSNEMVKEWLASGMFEDVNNADQIIETILQELGDHALNLSHARHISMQRCINMGLKVVKLEEDDDLQDAVLSLHHTCLHTLGATRAIKIIENQMGVAFIQQI